MAIINNDNILNRGIREWLTWTWKNPVHTASTWGSRPSIILIWEYTALTILIWENTALNHFHSRIYRPHNLREVKRPEGHPARSRGPEGPYTSVILCMLDVYCFQIEWWISKLGRLWLHTAAPVAVWIGPNHAYINRPPTNSEFNPFNFNKF